MANSADQLCTSMSSKLSITSNPRRLDGKVAIITGGASGIGACAAELFSENGAKVIIADIQDKPGQELADKLGQDAKYVHCNVSNEEEVVNLIDTTVTAFGKLDIMFNNAGVIDNHQGGILTTTKSDLERLLNVNLIGGFLGAKHAARVMIPQKSGCILFTASAAASIAGLSTHSYAATKHAIVGLAKNLAAELGRHGVRVNCVSPYVVRTNIAQGMGEYTHEMEAMISKLGNLQGNILKAEDVAKAALYLASDEANYVSGLNLVVDGGFSIVNPSLMNASAAAARRQWD